MQYLENYELSGKSKELAKLIKERFNNIRNASHELGISRVSIYSWIDKGEISLQSREKIRQAGYDPDTLKKL